MSSLHRRGLAVRESRPSGRFGLIRLGNRGEKARAVPLELHRSHPSHILQGVERSRTSHREFSKRTIGEYNICGHVFLARDRRAHGFERGEEAFLSGSDHDIVADIGKLRFVQA